MTWLLHLLVVIWRLVTAFAPIAEHASLWTLDARVLLLLPLAFDDQTVVGLLLRQKKVAKGASLGQERSCGPTFPTPAVPGRPQRTWPTGLLQLDAAEGGVSHCFCAHQQAPRPVLCSSRAILVSL